jgi:hypothetical protein
MQGNPDAIKNRERVVQHMSAAEIGEAQQLAKDWKPKR